MERVRRLSEFWSWLPAFRAVAETEHLPTASENMHITPSALSRTVRLLEESVGVPLFAREGRNIRLDPNGEVLLTAVRDAMRLVHDGLLAIERTQFRGSVHVAVAGPFAPSFVLPALRDLATSHPELVPTVQSLDGGVAGRLKRGQLDLAVVDDPVAQDGLDVSELLTLDHDVCCAPDDPAATALDVDVESLPFVAPIADARGLRPDAWPPHRPRRVALEVRQMQVAIDAVRQGGYVAALPIRVAERAGLVPLGIQGLRTTRLCIVRRKAQGLQGRADLVADAIRERVTEAQ